MNSSNHLLELLAEWEGTKLRPYKDIAGLLTIGTGHLLTKEEKNSGNIIINGNTVYWKDGITEEESLQLLSQDIKPCEKVINDNIKIPLSQHKFDALVSFIFNVGVNAFKYSTLLKRLNQANYKDIPNEFRKWVKSGGKIVPGLINRRNKEIELWNGNI